MELDEFLRVTETRLPSAAELVRLCDGLGFRFVAGENGPALRYGVAENLEVAALLAQLLRREPWRSQVIEAKGLTAPAAEARPPADRPIECLWGGGYIG